MLSTQKNATITIKSFTYTCIHNTHTHTQLKAAFLLLLLFTFAICSVTSGGSNKKIYIKWKTTTKWPPARCFRWSLIAYTSLSLSLALDLYLPTTLLFLLLFLPLSIPPSLSISLCLSLSRSFFHCCLAPAAFIKCHTANLPTAAKGIALASSISPGRCTLLIPICSSSLALTIWHPSGIPAWPWRAHTHTMALVAFGDFTQYSPDVCLFVPRASCPVPRFCFLLLLHFLLSLPLSNIFLVA